MKYRKILKTDLEVSPICLGTMTFGTPVSRDDAVKLIDYALGQDINFIDTANIYEGYTRQLGSEGGVAEECIGRALKGRRSKAVVATKAGMSVGETPLDSGLKKEAVEHNLTKSLKRLQTDYIDIYYAHKFDENVSAFELASAMNTEIKKGRIRHWAVSNYSGLKMAELVKTCDEHGLVRPVMSQPPLSLLCADALTDIINLCAREKIAVVPYKVLQGGLLTGKYRKEQATPQGSRMKEKPDWVPALTDAEAEKLEKIRAVCEALGVSMTEYAIDFVLRQAGVASAIIGVKNTAQIDAAIKAAEK